MKKVKQRVNWNLARYPDYERGNVRLSWSLYRRTQKDGLIVTDQRVSVAGTRHDAIIVRRILNAGERNG